MSTSINGAPDDSKQLLTARDGGPEGGQVRGPRAGWRLAIASFVENKLAVAGSAIVRVLHRVLLPRSAPVPHESDQHEHPERLRVARSRTPARNRRERIRRARKDHGRRPDRHRDRTVLLGHRDVHRHLGWRHCRTCRRHPRRDPHEDRGRAPVDPDPARGIDRERPLRRDRVSPRPDHRDLLVARIGEARPWRGAYPEGARLRAGRTNNGCEPAQAHLQAPHP